jgi:hypothetical protein
VPIAVDKNTLYGPPLVTQKYRPLNNVAFVMADMAVYSALLRQRVSLLRANGLFPRGLRLIAANWANAANQPGQHPPLVVVSSNRSAWIAAGIAAADTQSASLNLNPPFFNSPSDLRALEATAGQTQSSPIYAPARLGPAPGRKIYIVVHAAEYDLYKNNLAGLGVDVIGWEFKTGRGQQNRPRIMTGFGASRYAAIEFCKYLRTRATAALGPVPWNFAWLLDDNVVAMTNFAGFAAVEAAMAATDVCAGFQGGTTALAFSTNRNWARAEVAAGRTGVPPPALAPVGHLGIIQQASLWNIAYMIANNLNFGPGFVASAEDLSIGNHFDQVPIPYLWFAGIGVRKEVVAPHDNLAGAQRVSTGRNLVAKFLADAEALNPAQPRPAAPLQIQPINNADGGVQILGTFVTSRVLPNSAMNLQANDADVQNNAKCQAVEQLTSGAIASGFVTPQALADTFSTAGNAAANIIPVDRP